MSSVWLYALVSVFAVSLVSLIGGFTVALKPLHLKKALVFLIAFAAGALLGDVFIHLFPELLESGEFTLATSFCILAGIMVFFILEKVLHWRHCHLSATPDHIHPLAYINLVGDTLHNFTDGMVIAGSFLVSVPLGIATTVAVTLHEIPQELGDFGILLHSGMSIRRALVFNFLTALTAVAGALLALFFAASFPVFVRMIIPVTIGGFLYISTADLIPELHKDTAPVTSFVQLLSFCAGVAVMLLLLLLE